MSRIIFVLLASVALKSALAASVGGQALSLNIGDNSETCADLNNKGAYFSVNVTVGTPIPGTEQQTFELVADTGSDSVIVASCICVHQGYCNNKTKCFTGHNHSSSFIVKEKVSAKTNKSSPVGMALAFGSGVIVTLISTDVVTVGGQASTLSDGVLLMVDSRMLRISGEFEGILGLGPPDFSDPNSHEEVLNSESSDPMHNSHAKKPVDPDDQEPAEDEPAPHKNKKKEGKGLKPDWGSRVHKKKVNKTKAPYKAQLFLQQAGVERYSLCLNDGGTPGSMRMNVPKFTQPLPTVGTFHWGLGLHGISAGDEKAEAFSCRADNMSKGQVTPCGAIPDSGTTLLMGPAEHINKMYAGLCDKWDRCKSKQEEEKFKNTTKSNLFQELLHNCSQWRTDDKGIDEVPSVFFEVGEKGTNTQKLELTAWSYIVETSEEIYEYHKRYLFGVIPIQVPKPTGKWEKVCVPQFGAQDYDTKANGPVWIMGHPLFYQFTVGYSLGLESKVRGAKGKMEMAFEVGKKCGSCSDSKKEASLLELEAPVHKHGQARAMRTMTVPPRVRHYESGTPL